jgi:hypothetical protein
MAWKDLQKLKLKLPDAQGLLSQIDAMLKMLKLMEN